MDAPLKENDHHLDGIRYMCMHVFPLVSEDEAQRENVYIFS
jgi:hypothetical protein